MKGDEILENYYVYCHTNILNNKRYIGITKQIPEHRWGKDGINYKSSPHFWSAICKYGWDSFTHEVLFSNLCKKDACNKEIELIKEFRTQERDFGYNTFEGGEAPSIPLEVRAKMSKAMMGNTNGLGKVCSDEKKLKISKAQKGKTLSDEHRANISKAKAGKTHKPISQEARQKIADAHQKFPVLCVETGIIYPSIQSCARELGLYATNVCKCCKGKIKSTGGFHLRYVSNDSI